MAVAQIGTITQLVAGTGITAAQLNTNYDDIKTAFNNLVTGADQLAGGLTVSGAFTVEGDLTVGGAATNRLILPASNDAVSPTLAFGSGGNGFFQEGTTSIGVALSGGHYWQMSNSKFGGRSTKACFLYENPTATNPSMVPGVDDLDTGIGKATADELSLIAGGVETLRLTTTEATVSGLLTATSTATIGAATDPVEIGRASDSTTNGALTLNGSLTRAGMLGFYGSAAGGTLVLNTPTGGGHSVRINNVEVLGINGIVNFFSGGDFRVGDGSAIATTATSGFLLIPGCAGTPTGNPTNDGLGAVALVYDTTNNILYANDNNGGTWIAV